jgi:hypothetical protein
MEKIKKGKDSKDTWIKMLMNIPGCSEAKAVAISSTFSSAYDLKSKLATLPNPENELENIKIPSKTSKEIRIGPVIANRICQVILGRDGQAIF